jgi:hypothetical protein
MKPIEELIKFFDNIFFKLPQRYRKIADKIFEIIVCTVAIIYYIVAVGGPLPTFYNEVVNTTDHRLDNWSDKTLN